MAHLEVAVKRGRDHLVVDLHVLKGGAEGGVAAVVRPVGVDDADLGDGGDALLAGKVALAELDVGQVHGQAAVGYELGQLFVREVKEALELLHGLGGGVVLE